MPPKTPGPSSGDLFRMLLETIIDQNHELGSAGAIDRLGAV